MAVAAPRFTFITRPSTKDRRFEAPESWVANRSHEAARYLADTPLVPYAKRALREAMASASDVTFPVRVGDAWLVRHGSRREWYWTQRPFDIAGGGSDLHPLQCPVQLGAARLAADPWRGLRSRCADVFAFYETLRGATTPALLSLGRTIGWPENTEGACPGLTRLVTLADASRPQVVDAYLSTSNTLRVISTCATSASLIADFEQQPGQRWRCSHACLSDLSALCQCEVASDQRHLAFVQPLAATGSIIGAVVAVVRLEHKHLVPMSGFVVRSARPAVAWLPKSNGVAMVTAGISSRGRLSNRRLLVWYVNGERFEEPTPPSFPDGRPLVSTDGRRVILVTGGGVEHRSSVRLPWIASLRPGLKWRPFLPSYEWSAAGVLSGRSYVTIHHGQHPRGRLVSIPIRSAKDPKTWKTVIPTGTSDLRAVARCDARWIVKTEEAGNSGFAVFTRRGKLLTSSRAPENGAYRGQPGRELLGPLAEGLALDRPFGQVSAPASFPLLVQSFTSLRATGAHVIDLRSGMTEQLVVWFENPRTRVRRISTPAADGGRVDVDFLLAAGAAERFDRGERLALPAVVYAYGHRGDAVMPVPPRLGSALVAQGAVYAIAHVRGGDYGWGRRSWSRRWVAPDSTLDDLRTAVSLLVSRGVADHSRVGLIGQCAGAALAASAICFQPRLFRAVAAYGIVDPYWYTYFCSPGDERFGVLSTRSQERAFLRASPSHRLKRRVTYPAVLIGWSFGDQASPAWQAWSYFAALERAARKSRRPILLRDFARGHSSLAALSGSPIHGGYDVLAFLARELGLQDAIVSGGATCQ